MKNYTYRFELRPTKEQKHSLLQDFGNCRFIYNHFLDLSIKDYKRDGGSWDRFGYQKQIVDLKKQNKRLKQTNSQSLQGSLKNLDVAYGRFFKGQAKFPDFKNRNSKQSMSIPQFFKVEGDKVKIPKYDWMKFRKSREIEGKIKSLTISKDATDRYYITMLVEKDIEHLPKTGKKVGVDLGLKDLAITSDKKSYATIKYDDTKIKRLQMWLSKKQKGSRRYKQLKAKIAKLHKSNANKRSNYLHHISKELVTEYDLIALENLNVAGMMKNRRLSYSIGQQGWHELTRQIEYKANRYGKQAHKIGRWYPSSKQCNKCGHVKRDLKLSDRVYKCECGHVADRDVNAAKNILDYAQREMNL